MIDLSFWRRFSVILAMNHGKTVLAQVLDGLHPESFRRCSQRWPMPRDTPALSAYDQFAAMVFAQLTYRESLRDIEACLASRRRVLYHAGIRGAVKRCNLAYANEHRDWRLFADVAAVLMRQARKVYQDRPAELDLDGDLFALDCVPKPTAPEGLDGASRGLPGSSCPTSHNVGDLRRPISLGRALFGVQEQYQPLPGYRKSARRTPK